MKTDSHYTAVITSDCVCVKYDEKTEKEVVDEQGNPVPSDTCYDCYTESVYDFYDNLLPEWLDHFGLDKEDTIKLHSSRANWDYISGWSPIKVKDIVKELSENIGQFRLTFYLSKDYEELEVVRASHDEQGSVFTITKLTPAEQEFVDLNY
jgi:hypothetical protein